MVEAERVLLKAIIANLEKSNPHARYLVTTVIKYRQVIQELTTSFENETEMSATMEHHIADTDAEDICKATLGFGTDEELLGKVVVSRLKETVVITDKIFQQRYGKSLEDLVQKEGKSLLGMLTGSLSDFGRFISYRVMAQGRRDALLLKKCVSGLGCSDKPLVEILSTRTNAELKEAAREWKKEFPDENDMVERIKSETGGMLKKNYGKWIDTLLEFDRDESDVISQNVDELAERLYKAGAARTMGCDEDVFLEILCKASEKNIMAIRQAYETKYPGRDLVKDVASKMTGDLEFSVLARVRPTFDFLAKRIYDACKGFGTDEEIIARILGCLVNSHVMLLVERYNQVYADKEAPFNNFRALMESELSGDFLDAILMLLDNPSPKAHWVQKALYSKNAIKDADVFKAQVLGSYTVEQAIQQGSTPLFGPLQLIGVDLADTFISPNIDDHYLPCGPVPVLQFNRDYLLASEVTEFNEGQQLLAALKEHGAAFTATHQMNEFTIQTCTFDYSNLAHTMRHLDTMTKQLTDDNNAMMEFSIERDVDTVREACEGWGTDENRLIKVLCSLNKKQLAHVDTLYQSKFGKTLKEECDGELTAFFGSSRHFADFMDVILTPAPELDAKLLIEAMKGWGTDESLLTEIICTRTNLELKAAKAVFCEKQGKSIEQWVTDDTGEEEGYMRFLLRCLRADRAECVLDPNNAIKQAEIVASCLENKDNESHLFDILATASVGQLELIKIEFAKQGGTELIPAIVEGMSGDLEKALVARCTPKHQFFAKLIHDAWEGWGTDETTTSRVFGRCSKSDIKKIAEEYTKLTGVDFKVAIDKETSGYYQKALMTYVFNEPPPSKSADDVIPSETA